MHCSCRPSPHECCGRFSRLHLATLFPQVTAGNLHGIAWEEAEVAEASAETAAAKVEEVRAAKGARGAWVEGMVAGMVAVRVAKEAKAAVAMGEEGMGEEVEAVGKAAVAMGEEAKAAVAMGEEAKAAVGWGEEA